MVLSGRSLVKGDVVVALPSKRISGMVVVCAARDGGRPVTTKKLHQS